MHTVSRQGPLLHREGPGPGQRRPTGRLTVLGEADPGHPYHFLHAKVPKCRDEPTEKITVPLVPEG